MSHAKKYFEKVLTTTDEAVLMRVKMSGMNPHRVGAVNLRAKFQFDFLGIYFCGRGPVVMKITVFVDQAGNFVLWSDGAPAVVHPFAGSE